MPLKIALVGCGKVADAHVEEIQKMPQRAQLTAVCDRELLMAEQLAVRYRLPAHYDSFDAMLIKERPDVVHIATPPQSHAALARAAIDAGCHVLIEKPLAPTYAESRAVVEYAANAGKQLTVGHTYLFDPPALQMRELVANGTVGEVVHVESWYGYDFGSTFGAAVLADPTHWVHDLPGRLIHNNIDHLLNKLIEFIDDDEPEISATGWCRRAARFGDVRDEMHDELRVSILGQRVSAYATFSAHVRPVPHFARVYGRKNTAHVDYANRTVTLEPTAALPAALGKVLPAFSQARQFLRQGWRNSVAFARADFHYFSGLNRLFAMFYDAVEGKAAPPISSRDMVRVAQWTDRIFAQTGARS